MSRDHRTSPAASPGRRSASSAAPDREAVLRALRPRDAGADQGWRGAHLDAVRQRILASSHADVDHAPSGRGATKTGAVHEPVDLLRGSGHGRGAPRTGRRRASLALAVALLVTGTGAAAASGHLPSVFTDAFADWATWDSDGIHGADPTAAVRVGSTPGPAGTVFSVMATPTTGTGGAATSCTVAVFESTASSAQPIPTDYQDVSGSGCTAAPTGAAFGSLTAVDLATASTSPLGAVAAGGADAWVWTTAAGTAVTAHVLTADGRTWPAVVHAGALYGWFPAPRDGSSRPQVVGFAADGTEVGRTAL